MSCYVDRLAARGWRLGESCHLIADTLVELHDLARRIGLKRAWFQEKSTPHYDLTASRRARAVRLGAIELDRRGLVAKIRELRGIAQKEEDLNRGKTKAPPAPEETEPDTTLHLRLDKELRGELDIIVGWMEQDPDLRRLRVKLGREKAIRYVIGYAIANPPAHVGTTGR